MMLIHSAFSPIASRPGILTENLSRADPDEYLLKCAAYHTACNKYSAEIEAVQQFFPGWLPNPPSK